MVKANAGDTSLIPGSGRSPGERNGNPLQSSCLGNSMDRGDWQTTVYGIEKELDTTYQLNNNKKLHNSTSAISGQCSLLIIDCRIWFLLPKFWKIPNSGSDEKTFRVERVQIILNKYPWGMDARGFIKVVYKDCWSFIMEKPAPRSLLIFFTNIPWIRSFRLKNITYTSMSSLCHAYQREESSWVSKMTVWGREKDDPGSNMCITGQFLTKLLKHSLFHIVLWKGSNQNWASIWLERRLRKSKFLLWCSPYFWFISLLPHFMHLEVILPCLWGSRYREDGDSQQSLGEL